MSRTNITAEDVYVDLSDYFTVPELAKHLRISEPTVYLLVKKGQLPALRIAKHTLRFPKRLIEEWANEKWYKQNANLVDNPKEVLINKQAVEGTNL